MGAKGDTERRRAATLGIVLVLTAFGCGARTGLTMGLPPHTRVTEVCQSGFCLQSPFCSFPSLSDSIGTSYLGGILCEQGPDDGMFRRDDCLEAPPGGVSACAAFRNAFGRPGVPSRPVSIWAADGSEVTIECARPPVDTCDPFIQTNGVWSGLPDACLFSFATWQARNSIDSFFVPGPGGTPLPWEPAGAFESFLELCGPLQNEPCPLPSGGDRSAANTRSLWCGGLSTDSGSYSCDYAPAVLLPGTSLSQLSAYQCPKLHDPTNPLVTGPLATQRDFFVEGDALDPNVASRNAGRLGGAYCNMLGDRTQLGRLPPEDYLLFHSRSPGSTEVVQSAPFTVFAVRDPANCEHQIPNDGVAEPALDPGVAQDGQRATSTSASSSSGSSIGSSSTPGSIVVRPTADSLFAPVADVELVEGAVAGPSETPGLAAKRAHLAQLARDTWAWSGSGAISLQVGEQGFAMARARTRSHATVAPTDDPGDDPRNRSGRTLSVPSGSILDVTFAVHLAA